jgi:hypothetical protein
MDRKVRYWSVGEKEDFIVDMFLTYYACIPGHKAMEIMGPSLLMLHTSVTPFLQKKLPEIAMSLEEKSRSPSTYRKA